MKDKAILGTSIATLLLGGCGEAPVQEHRAVSELEEAGACYAGFVWDADNEGCVPGEEESVTLEAVHRSQEETAPNAEPEESEQARSNHNFFGSGCYSTGIPDAEGNCIYPGDEGYEDRLSAMEDSGNCAPDVVEDNLARLEDLNIVAVDGLADFACTGYCFESTEPMHRLDRCDKAEALATLVELADQLRVRIKY